MAILHVGPVVGTLIDVKGFDRTALPEVFDVRGVAPSQVSLTSMPITAIQSRISHL
jgi:hypothetical protein